MKRETQRYKNKQRQAKHLHQFCIIKIRVQDNGTQEEKSSDLWEHHDL